MNTYFDIKPRKNIYELNMGELIAHYSDEFKRKNNITIGKKIDVTHVDEITCTGHGRATCVKNNEHSWFSHAMDSYYANPNIDNYPPGYERGL
jgi:hypothetical protein